VQGIHTLAGPFASDFAAHYLSCPTHPVRSVDMTGLHPDLARVILSEQEIQKRNEELAAQISADYADVEKLYLIGILKGAFIFLADLARRLTIPHAVDFMALSSYGKSSVHSGEVRILMDLREPIVGQHLLLVEDIVDTGLTIGYLRRTLKGRQPASIRTCALTRKPAAIGKIPVDYLGFDIPDVWVVGYGLDYADKHRTLPFIAELRKAAYQSDSG
jgi:hypoxanthine phosphoribosyltransferase